MSRHNPEEIWRYIPDYEDYTVSSWGRVYSLRFDRLLDGRRGTDGRRKIRLYNNGEWLDKYVHQCMARAFVVGHEWGDPVGHWDGDYTNNHITNLNLHVYNFGLNMRPEWFYWEDE